MAHKKLFPAGRRRAAAYNWHMALPEGPSDTPRCRHGAPLDPSATRKLVEKLLPWRVKVENPTGGGAGPVAASRLGTQLA